ncbi:MAG: ABC transporter ATP-binding protein [Promethearchaeota archaeon]
MSNRTILFVENLKGYYRGTFGTVHGVDGVSLEVKKGEIVAIAGESGCGKSTLAELITGTPMPLLHYESGTIIVDGYEIYKIDPEVLRKEVKCCRMSYVPQASMDSLNPVKRIYSLISDVVQERTGQKMPKEELLKMAEDHFERVGLEKSTLNRYPHELSGGMKQRAVIAISTLWNPKLLIVDEPTSALDVSSQKRMILMLHELKKEGIIETILFVSHDLSTLRQLCDKCMIMYAGQMMEYGQMDDIISDPLHPYTQALISSYVAFKTDGTQHSRLESIPGRHPDLRNPPPGCRFHPRCEKAMPKCKTNEPDHLEIPDKNRYVKCWLYLSDDI